MNSMPPSGPPLEKTAAERLAPFEGRGYSSVDGKRLDWAPFDTFAVPGGRWCEHVNASDREPAVLFVASDEPTLKAVAGLAEALGGSFRDALAGHITRAEVAGRLVASQVGAAKPRSLNTPDAAAPLPTVWPLESAPSL